MLHTGEMLHPKIASSFTILYSKTLEKTTKYRFWLQKGVKIEIEHRIRIRDPQIVYEHIYYFLPKMVATSKT